MVKFFKARNKGGGVIQLEIIGLYSPSTASYVIESLHKNLHFI